jgi:hypothetical protein
MQGDKIYSAQVGSFVCSRCWSSFFATTDFKRPCLGCDDATSSHDHASIVEIRESARLKRDWCSLLLSIELLENDSLLIADQLMRN